MAVVSTFYLTVYEFGNFKPQGYYCYCYKAGTCTPLCNRQQICFLQTWKWWESVCGKKNNNKSMSRELSICDVLEMNPGWRCDARWCCWGWCVVRERTRGACVVCRERTKMAVYWVLESVIHLPLNTCSVSVSLFFFVCTFVNVTVGDEGSFD